MPRKRMLILCCVAGLMLVSFCGACQWNASASSQAMEQLVESGLGDGLEEVQASEAPVVASGEGQTQEEKIIAVYDAASLSVVNITSVDYVHDRMLGEIPEEGIGSGFVYDSDGHIVTNFHVIEGADELIVTLATGEEFEAAIVGSDSVNDLAVLAINAGELLPSPLELADSDQVRVGETVLAIGNPYGLDLTLTTGVISALGRVITGSEEGQFIAEAIQTDAAINPGNSGGPLLNMQGEVIGVNSQIVSSSGSSAGLGFAISAKTLQVVVPDLISNGVYLHPWLGVETVDLSAYSAAVLRKAGMDVPVESGVLVIGVERGSPAEEVGMQAGDRMVRMGRYILPIGGDIIVSVNDVPVESLQDLMVYLEMRVDIGDTIDLTVIRSGAQRTISLKLVAQQTAN